MVEKLDDPDVPYVFRKKVCLGCKEIKLYSEYRTETKRLRPSARCLNCLNNKMKENNKKKNGVSSSTGKFNDGRYTNEKVII